MQQCSLSGLIATTFFHYLNVKTGLWFLAIASLVIAFTSDTNCGGRTVDGLDHIIKTMRIFWIRINSDDLRRLLNQPLQLMRNYLIIFVLFFYYRHHQNPEWCLEPMGVRGLKETFCSRGNALFQLCSGKQRQ